VRYDVWVQGGKGGAQEKKLLKRSKEEAAVFWVKTGGAVACDGFEEKGDPEAETRTLNQLGTMVWGKGNGQGGRVRSGLTFLGRDRWMEEEPR